MPRGRTGRTSSAWRPNWICGPPTPPIRCRTPTGRWPISATVGWKRRQFFCHDPCAFLSSAQGGAGMIRLGTSGFSYDDWVGSFYPPGLPKREWLAYYAREFDTVELNVTYYRIPDRRPVVGWTVRTPPGFLFAVKAFSGLTHERQAPDFAGFIEAIEPLRQAGKLGCILAQFPHAF